MAVERHAAVLALAPPLLGWLGIGALLFALVLAPRLIARDVVITADEDNWMRRAGGFAYGLTTGQLGRTYQNGHPGVTTMWIATLTLGPTRMVQYADRVHNQRLVGRVAGFWDALVDARVGFGLVTALLVCSIAALAGRLFGAPTGLLAGVVVGLEPFYLAISQLVHMDAILGGCMVASVLAALVRWREGATRWWMAASGALAGLALLSKSPAAFLLLFVPGFVLLAAVRARGPAGPRRRVAFRSASLDLLVWAGVTALAVVSLWPAIWALGPIEVLSRVAQFTRETGGQPHEAGTFFLGSPRADPGPLFYPVALAFRLGPLTMAGLAALALLWARTPSANRGPALVLVLYCLGFLAMMTLGAKKFDRYLLPIVPALGVLAALGLARGLDLLGSAARRSLATVALLVLGVIPLAATFPYYLSYYNPALGGGSVAQRAVMVGNGEGLDQVARWLNARPNADDLWVVSHSFDILQPLIVASGEPLRDRVPSNADYVVLYRFGIQIGHSPRVLAEYLDRREPEFSVWINGIEYARVYRGPHRAAMAPGSAS